MEASVAAGGEAAAAAGEQGGAEAPAVDLGPVLERFDQLGQRMDSFDSQLQQFGQPPAEEDQTGLEFDPETMYEPDGQLDGQAVAQYLQQLQQSSEQSTKQAIEAALAPVLQRVEDMQIDRDATSLVESFPQLADPQVAEATVSQAMTKAQELGIDPSLARRPGFIELVIQSELGRQAAAGEVPVDGIRQHSLEAGAGAAPGGRGEGPSVAEQILQAGKAKSSFWGV